MSEELLTINLTITIPQVFTKELLSRILWSADTYSPPYLFGYEWTKGKSWVGCVLDGETVKFVVEGDLDTKIFWGTTGPDKDESGIKIKIVENAEILELNLEKLKVGLKPWAEWYVKRYGHLPVSNDFDCDMDIGFALLQFALFGDIIIG